jgi:hypothetical protein
VDSADEVLIRASGNCGWYDLSPSTVIGPAGNLTESYINSMDALAVSSRLSMTASRQIAKSCYPWQDGSEPDLYSLTCSSQVVPYLKSTVDRPASCPFAPEACSQQAISFQSGEIDSHLQLGINAAPSDRIQFYRSLTCAPVPLEERYSYLSNASNSSDGAPLTVYYFGDDQGSPPGTNEIFTMEEGNIGDASPYSPR